MKKSITFTFACLHCRKAFKKYRFNLNGSGSWEKIAYDVVCPQCGGEVYDAGSAFKSPKRSDIKAWKQLEPLFRSGYRFNPDFGNPFKVVPVCKKSHLLVIKKSEFRKPARKRIPAKRV